MAQRQFEVFQKARVLLIDADQTQRERVQALLTKAGCEQFIARSPGEDLTAQLTELSPDLVVLDPGSDLTRLVSVRAGLGDDALVPIVVFTSAVSPVMRCQALELGATDFLAKPGDPYEILLRVKNFLRIRAIHCGLQVQNRSLAEVAADRTRELEESKAEILARLAMASEWRDDDTGEHTKRVGQMSASIAAELGWPAEEVRKMSLAAPLHDLGKIGIPDAILHSVNRLTREEFETMKSHASIGAAILAKSRSPFLQMAESIAISHHERWDGSGYPSGLAGDEIPPCGRIVAVADVFDALTHARPYKRAWTAEEAIAEIKRMSGVHFDPAVVTAFLKVVYTVVGHSVRVSALGPQAPT